ncbi:unnamed protein product [Prorocentrum cordatum]|uniref:Protochlorophyllide reductase n=1 Tax=Prorocentrum cordatum TaxID=2364126 RepID=A0ABN9VFX6_9DINO|nr:unnamed protein product [Polarella glacialis]
MATVVAKCRPPPERAAPAVADPPGHSHARLFGMLPTSCALHVSAAELRGTSRTRRARPQEEIRRDLGLGDRTAARPALAKSWKLLSQGLNVVIVARGEPVFDETVKEFKKLFPKQEVRQVKADLSDGSGAWMADVKEATKDVSVQIVFNNAGFILTGFFEQHPAEKQLANFHCNLTANVLLTHHFYSEMLSKGLKGCIVYTSSSAGFIPNPFAAMYGCTKAGVSELAASLAVEGKSRGIDVHSVHPSPVNSRFTSGGGNDIKVTKIEAMTAAYKFATGDQKCCQTRSSLAWAGLQ